MGKPYSMDLRERVRAEIANGGSRRAAARRYDVSPSFAVKLIDRSARALWSRRGRAVRPAAVSWRRI